MCTAANSPISVGAIIFIFQYTMRHQHHFKVLCFFMSLVISTRGVSWSLPVFSIKKTLNSQGNLKKILLKVLTIGFYTFCPSFRQIMNTIPNTFSLSRQTIRRAIFRLLQNWRSAALRVSVPSMRKSDSRTGRGLESTAGVIIFPNSMLLMCSSPL